MLNYIASLFFNIPSLTCDQQSHQKIPTPRHPKVESVALKAIQMVVKIGSRICKQIKQTVTPLFWTKEDTIFAHFTKLVQASNGQSRPLNEEIIEYFGPSLTVDKLNKILKKKWDKLDPKLQQTYPPQIQETLNNPNQKTIMKKLE